MARGKAHDDETKASVMAALLAGQGISEVAAAHKLSETTVGTWKKSIDPSQFVEVRAKKSESINELFTTYLSANLRALTAQANVASDETYLKQHPPQQLAVLHGVMADKAVRLLEIGSGYSEPSEGEEEDAEEEEAASVDIEIEYVSSETTGTSRGTDTDQSGSESV